MLFEGLRVEPPAPTIPSVIDLAREAQGAHLGIGPKAVPKAVESPFQHAGTIHPASQPVGEIPTGSVMRTKPVPRPVTGTRGADAGLDITPTESLIKHQATSKVTRSMDKPVVSPLEPTPNVLRSAEELASDKTPFPHPREDNLILRLREHGVIASDLDRARATQELNELVNKVKAGRVKGSSLPPDMVDQSGTKLAMSSQPVDDLNEFHLPSLLERAFLPDDAITTLERTGPWGKVAATVYRDWQYKAQSQTVSGMADLEKVFDTFWRRRPMYEGKRLNPYALTTTDKIWDVSQAELRDLVDYMYAGGITPSKTVNPRTLAMGQAIKDKVLFPAQNHEGVRTATVRGPTGDYPVGAPGLYYPHNPSTERASENLQGRLFDWMYDKAKASDPTLPESLFRDRLNKYNDAMRFRREPGVETARMWDASKGGTESAYDNLRAAGFGIDPYRDMFHALKGLYNVGEKNLAEPVLRQAEIKMLEAAKGGDDKWVRLILERMRGVDQHAGDEVIRRLVDKALNLNNAVLLQYATIPQFNQLSYVISRGGFFNTVKAIWDVGVKGGGQEVRQRSSALFSVYNQDLAGKTDDVIGKWAQGVLRANAFAREDAQLRVIAGRTGDIQLHGLYRDLKKNPLDSGARAQVREFQLDPDKFLAEGLTDQNRMRAASAFANNTQGRNTLEGLPLYMNNNSNMVRLFKQYKNFLFTNAVELKRQTMTALRNGVPPSIVVKRMLKGTIAAGVLGELTTDLSYGLINWDSPLTDKRVPKWMRESMGAEIGRVVQDVINGAAGITFTLAASLAQGDKDRTLEFLTAPVIAVILRGIQDPLGMAARVAGGPIGPTLERSVRDSRQEGPSAGYAPFNAFPKED